MVCSSLVVHRTRCLKKSSLAERWRNPRTWSMTGQSLAIREQFIIFELYSSSSETVKHRYSVRRRKIFAIDVVREEGKNLTCRQALGGCMAKVTEQFLAAFFCVWVSVENLQKVRKTNVPSPLDRWSQKLTTPRQKLKNRYLKKLDYEKYCSLAKVKFLLEANNRASLRKKLHQYAAGFAFALFLNMIGSVTVPKTKILLLCRCRMSYVDDHNQTLLDTQSNKNSDRTTVFGIRWQTTDKTN